ncbi:MAG: ABC transporter substrate-binding protein [Lentisphaerae bacterium]|nr:ABC transporter substrate-binding protein [Lentisphaerota bacterium]
MKTRSANSWNALPAVALVVVVTALLPFSLRAAERSYQEAPDLAALAKAGTLPPVADRLPTSPLVVTPCDEIGTYGGVWRRAHLGPKDAYGVTYMLKETLLLHTPDYKKVIPNICQAYEWSPDYKVLTFHLRKGMRWSDGAPFTADDFLFWHEDFASNTSLSPVFPLWLKRDGKPMVMTKIDDHAFQLTFVKPYAALTDYLAGLWNPTLYLPKHYCMQFHPKYTPMAEIEERMKTDKTDPGFTHWVDYFRRKTYYVKTPGCPTINAWQVVDRISSQVQRWKRNPFYWKVDPAGNQLPYLDGLRFKLVSDAEAVVLQAAAGEIDMQMRRIGGINVVGIENYPLLMENRERGRYRVLLRDIFRQNKFAVLFNYHSRDADTRELFNDLRFRTALSHAIDRDEMNEFCMQGLGKPGQVMPNPKSRWFDSESADFAIDYNLEKANAMLDEIGLPWDRRHSYRLRPNGKVLMFNMKIPGPLVEACELLREQWRDVGIKLIVTPVESRYWYTMVRAGNYDLTCTGVNTGWDGCFMHVIVIPPYYSNYAAPLWDLWVRTNGEAGEEPPAWFRGMLDMVDEILSLPQCDKRVALVKEMQRVSIRRMLRVGGLIAPPQATFAVVRDNFRNVPNPIPNLMCCHPAIFYKRVDEE